MQGDLGLRGQALVTPQDVLDWAQEASDMLATETYWFRTEATAGTTASTKYYDFPAGLLMIEDLFHDGLQLRQVTQNEMAQINYDWRNESSGTPLYYYLRGANGYALHPTPSVTDVDILTLHYAALPPIPSDNDDFFTIPTSQDGAIITYCLYRAALKDITGEGRDRVAIYKAEWEQAKREFHAFVSGAQEGRLLVLGSDNSPSVWGYWDVLASGTVPPP